jgi:hypothetical protein
MVNRPVAVVHAIISIHATLQPVALPEKETQRVDVRWKKGTQIQKKIENIGLKMDR